MPPTRRSAYLRFLILFAVLLAGCRADQATKAWAQASFRDQNALILIPNVLEFRYAENTAIAFSLLHGLSDAVRTPLVLMLSGSALAALAVFIWRMRTRSLGLLIPLSLILAGGLGNLQDRLLHGYVVDFVWVHWKEAWSFPVFNLADSLVTVGTSLLLLSALRKPSGAAA